MGPAPARRAGALALAAELLRLPVAVAGFKGICVGAPKTGTTSLAQALEILGYKVYHDNTKNKNGRRLFGAADSMSTEHALRTASKLVHMGFDALVTPGYRVLALELIERFPDAWFLLTVREPRAWFRSYLLQSQAQVRLVAAHRAEGKSREADMLFSMWKASGLRSGCPFPLSKKDEEQCIAGYERLNAAIQDRAPAGRLLTFEVAAGWRPLCGFLGREVPDAAFPMQNTAGLLRLFMFEDAVPLWVRQIFGNLVLLLMFCCIGGSCVSWCRRHPCHEKST